MKHNNGLSNKCLIVHKNPDPCLLIEPFCFKKSSIMNHKDLRWYNHGKKFFDGRIFNYVVWLCSGDFVDWPDGVALILAATKNCRLHQVSGYFIIRDWLYCRSLYYNDTTYTYFSVTVSCWLSKGKCLFGNSGLTLTGIMLTSCCCCLATSLSVRSLN